MNVNVARVLILFCFSLFVNTAFCANKRGCLLNDNIYNVQLADVGIYRNQYYTQYYENFSSSVEPVKDSEVAYYQDPSKCYMWGYKQDLRITDAQKNGCIINGNESLGIGRPLEYELINYCSLPLDDYNGLIIVFSSIIGACFLRKNLFNPTESTTT
jgi:hypothetical protein